MATDIGTKLSRAAGELLALVDLIKSQGHSNQAISDMSYLLGADTVALLLRDAQKALEDRDA